MRQRPTKMNRLGLSAMLVVFSIEAAWMSPLGAQQQPLMVPSGADYYEILDLNAKFCHGLDTGANDGQMFANTFTEDGAFVDGDGKVTQGRQALAALARSMPGKGPANISHFMLNQNVNMASYGATQLSYLLIVGPVVDGQPAVVTAGGQFWDQLVKTSEGWRIQRRTLLKPGTPRPDASFFKPIPAPAKAVRMPAAAPGGLTPLDRAQIWQLYSHYAFSFDKALDGGLAFGNLFTLGGEMVDESGQAIVGRDKIAQAVLKKGPTDVRTYVTNVLLEQTPNGVTSRAYVMKAHLPPQPTPATIVAAGMFYDRLVKVSGKWMFAKNTLVAPHATVVPNALSTPAASAAAREEMALLQAAANALTADDYAAIQSLYSRYANGFDSKSDNGEMYLSVFTKTGAFTDQWDRLAEGKDALEKTYAHTTSGQVNPIGIGHSTWNVFIEPAPWGAIGRSYTGASTRPGRRRALVSSASTSI